MVTVIHKLCGKPAMLYDHVPVKGELILAEHAYNVDGTPKGDVTGMLVICEACGQGIQWVKEAVEFVEEGV